jgi:hypothetical protein
MPRQDQLDEEESAEAKDASADTRQKVASRVALN